MPSDRHPEEPESADAPCRRARFSPLGLGLRLAVASAMIAGLSLFALPAPRPAATGVATPPTVPPARVPTPAPAAFASARLGLAEPGIDPVRVTPGRLDPASGLREDALSRGAFDALDAPAFQMTLTRGAGAGRAPGLFVLLARRAATGAALSVMRTGGYGRIATKFGAAETLDITLTGRLRRTCTGFVTREADFRIEGWLCAPLGRPPEASALACTLDALSLDDPSDPAATAAFLAPPGRRAQGCDRPMAMVDPASRTGSIAGRRSSAAAPRSRQ